MTATKARTTKKKPVKHYSMFAWKTLCGVAATKGEETLSEQTSCKVCLKEAVKQHYQLALLANRILNQKKQ